MAQRTAHLPQSLTTGIIAGEVAALDAGAPPDWVRVAPAGRVETRDGRTFTFEAATLAARYTADAVDLPIDIDHAIARRGSLGEKADAVAWIKELSARPDGLWARVEWLESGLAVLSARTHRYISPTFRHDTSGRATWLHSVALVAAPALAMPAVADATGADQETSVLSAIAQALGLAGTADEAACLNAISTGVVPREVHAQTLANLAATTTELTALKDAIRKDKVDALIESALAAKKIVPAQRERYAALCATDDGLAQVTALLDATPANLPGSGLDTRQPPTGGGDDAVVLSARATEYRTRMAAGGVQMSMADAVIAVHGGAK